MPYKRLGTDVMHKTGKNWTVKQHCSSVRNAEIVILNLEKLDKNPKAKVFGEAKKKVKKLKITK